MTGIQALERIAKTLPMQPGRVERRKFQYERHGTLSLIANFHVVTGELVALTLGPTRTEEDFVAHVAHCSEGLVRWVAKTCGIEQELGKKAKRESYTHTPPGRSFSLIGAIPSVSCILPKHTSWLDQIEIVLGVIARKVIRRGSFT